MPVKSLSELCTRVCIQNIRDVTSLGDLLLDKNEYVRQILLKVDSAAQLHEIESNSPQLRGELEEFWRKLIQRDFPSLQKRKNYVPRDNSEWYRVYAKLSKQQKAEREEALQALKANFADIQKEKDKHVSRILDKKETRLLPKPPRTGRLLGVRKAGSKDLPSTLSFGAGSRMKMTTGQSVLRRARREAKEIANTRSTLSTPSGVRPIALGRVQKAPAAMLHEKRIAAQPAIAANAAVRSSVVPKKGGLTPVTDGNYISDSDSDEADADGNAYDPLFDDEEPKRSLSRPKTASSANAPTTSVNASKTRGTGNQASTNQTPQTKTVLRHAPEANMSTTQPRKAAASEMRSQPKASSSILPASGSLASAASGSADRDRSLPGPALAFGHDASPVRKRKAAGVFMKPTKRR